jgi:predicted  nucleic acid-binding Zn-ribbon protein
MSIAIAEATYSFPNGEPQSPAFVTVPASILDQILEELQALRAEVQDLKATVARQDGEISTLRLQIDALEARQDASQRRVATISDVQDEICDKIDEHAEALNTVWKAVKTTPAKAEPKGEKTLKRIAKLEAFLKARGSGATFQEVEKILDISPSELTRLIAKLDMRRFEVFARAGDGRQKVLRLKAQIH